MKMGYLLALAAIFFWSFNMIIASYFATTLSPYEIAFGRWFVAGLILITIAWKDILRHYKILFKNWGLVVSLALTGIVFDNTLIYFAGRTASAINMGLLDVTGPIFIVALTRIFYKVPVSKPQMLGLMVAILGVITIILQGDVTQITKIKLAKGDWWMLLNTLFFAVYSLLQKKRPEELSQSAMLGSTVIVGLVILFPLMLWQTGESRLLHMDMKELEVIIYLGIFNSVISYLAWNTALNKLGNLKTSIIYYALPIFAGIEAYYILGEKIYVSTILGGVMVIAGIAIVSLSKKKRALVENHGLTK